MRSRSTRKCVEGKVKLKGVSQRRGKYVAYIRDGRLINLGTFATAVEAAIEYDHEARRLYGEKAITNASLGLIGG